MLRRSLVLSHGPVISAILALRNSREFARAPRGFRAVTPTCRCLGRSAMGRALRIWPALALLLAAPGVLVFIGLRAFGATDGATASLAAAGVVVVAFLVALLPALSLAALIAAIERLGPE